LRFFNLYKKVFVKFVTVKQTSLSITGKCNQASNNKTMEDSYHKLKYKSMRKTEHRKETKDDTEMLWHKMSNTG